MDNVLIGKVVNPDKIYGKSAYEIAVMHGFDGTEEEWLNSILSTHNTDTASHADIREKIDAITVKRKSKNLFNPNTAIHGSYIDPSGNIVQNEYTGYYGIVKITDITDYVLTISYKIYNSNVPVKLYNYVSFNAFGQKTIITENIAFDPSITFTIPGNTVELWICLGSAYGESGWRNCLQIEYGSVATEYEEAHDVITTELKNQSQVDQNTKDIEKLKEGLSGNLRLSLPKQYYAVVGDTLEIFKKGLLEAYDTSNYNFKIYCEVGKNYKNRFVFTPTSNDANKQYTFKVTVSDDYGNVVAEETSKIVVTAKALTSGVAKNVLCVGDSLLRGGEWAIESHRRLTASDGTPVGDSVSNINYIGTCEKNGVKFEGYGGWSFDAYNTEHKSNAFMWIACTHDKTEVDQHSVYKDGNNKNWKIETIESNRIKVICTSSTSSALTSGTLTWVSGGVNHSDIVYTSAEQASGNPFWNETTDVVDFASYATKQGVTGIDYLYVLLGWNSTGVAIETYKTQVETFIANVHTAFPNCKIVLMGLQIPSIDGLGENYGTWWDYMEKIKVVFDFNEMYQSIADETDNVNFINIASQFDTEHGMPTGTRKVNVRSDVDEIYGTNGLHPANSGYMQIADAVYRDLTYKLVNDYVEPTEPVEPAVENLAIVNETNTTDTSIWCNNYRVSSSGYSVESGKSISNIINCSVGETIYVKGVTIDGDRIELTTSSVGIYRQYVTSCSADFIVYTVENDVHKFEIKHSSAVSIRFAFNTPTNFDEVYITKQPIS